MSVTQNVWKRDFGQYNYKSKRYLLQGNRTVPRISEETEFENSNEKNTP